mmetsp:Transcript_1363/g.2379  ORF Transcript_1363/g.2379 Transcript_1363/m.2379 type:complete len:223 (+) Transcript_1363:879-1547(+)
MFRVAELADFFLFLFGRRGVDVVVYTMAQDYAAVSDVGHCNSARVEADGDCGCAAHHVFHLALLMHGRITLQMCIPTTSLILLHTQIRPTTRMKCILRLLLSIFGHLPQLCRIRRSPLFLQPSRQIRVQFFLRESGTIVSCIAVSIEYGEECIAFSAGEFGGSGVVRVLIFLVGFVGIISALGQGGVLNVYDPLVVTGFEIAKYYFFGFDASGDSFGDFFGD